MRALETRVAIAAVVVAVVVMAIKLVAWIVTDSDAILSDALEALVNVAASLMALGAIRIAHRPADATHPYGHGRIEFISASIELLGYINCPSAVRLSVPSGSYSASSS